MAERLVSRLSTANPVIRSTGQRLPPIAIACRLVLCHTGRFQWLQAGAEDARRIVVVLLSAAIVASLLAPVLINGFGGSGATAVVVVGVSDGIPAGVGARDGRDQVSDPTTTSP